jgi:hypothetical protein
MFGWLAAALMSASTVVVAEDLKPFVLASSAAGSLQGAVDSTRSALKGAGFEVVGEYSPYANAHVIAVTNGALKAAAAKSEHGGFGAAQRVSVTEAGGSVQVAYANPAYTAAAFRMSGSLGGVEAKLASALGSEKAFGSEKGLSDGKLRKYHYMFAMPYFDDVDELATFDSHAAAVAHIDARLKAGVAGTKKVYRIDIPGKEETVFGVGISQGDGADAAVMKTADTADLKHTAHLPYQILVSGNRAIALPGKFRIATSFPDLGMGTFMQISNAPGAIRDVLAEVAAGK